MTRRKDPDLPDRHEPAAAFARFAVDAAQEGDLATAERLARLADRFAKLRLKLEPAELTRLGRMRRLEVRLDQLDFQMQMMIEAMDDVLTLARSLRGHEAPAA